MAGISLLIGISILVSLLFLHYLFGAEHPVRCAFCSGGLGVASLLAVHVVGLFTGISLPISLLSLFVSMALGPAGVSSLLICNTWIV